MEKVLDHFIANAPEGAASVQLSVGGQILAGAIRGTEWEGIYELLTIGQKMGENGASAQPVAVKIFVKASAIDTVSVMIEKEQPTLSRPHGILIPGR